MKRTMSPPELTFFENGEELKETFALQGDPDIQQYIFRLNEKYVHWDEVRHYRHPRGISSEIIWNLLKLSRMAQYRKIEIDEMVFRYVITDHIMKCLHELDQKTSGTLESKDETIAQEEHLDRYLINSVMEEAIASSQLEGAATTRKVAKELLRSGKKPKDESEQMIVNAYNTMLFLKEIKNEELSPGLICRIHSRITANTIEDRYSGEFRNNNEVHVVDSGTGESVHAPPDYKKVPRLVEALCRFINSETKAFLHPVLKAIILHFMIGYIHPFEDGNGRTARAMFYWYVLKKGFWLLEYVPISRVIKRAPGKYSRAYIYTENDENDLTYFFVFNLRQIKIALKEFIKYIKMKKTESERAKELMRKDTRINFRQSDIVLRFIKYPLRAFSINEIKQRYNIAYQTARTDLDLLAKLGYCKKMKAGRKFIYSYPS